MTIGNIYANDNDRTPYTYFIRWDDLNVNYYGKRTARGCHPEEFFISYFTSSKYVADTIAEYGMPDTIKVHKIFSDADSCNSQEIRFLKRVNAAKNINWLNKSNGGKNFDTSGIPKTIEQKQKISKSLTGSKLPDATKIKISVATSGKNNPMWGKSKELSPGYNKIWITNGIENFRIDKNEFIPVGYKAGQTQKPHKERMKETKPRKSKPTETIETRKLKSNNTTLRKKFVCCIETKKEYSKPHAVLYLPFLNKYF